MAVFHGISATTIRVINSILNSQTTSSLRFSCNPELLQYTGNCQSYIHDFCLSGRPCENTARATKNIARAANKLCVVVVLYANQDERMQSC